jgi:hypothetical protein
MCGICCRRCIWHIQTNITKNLGSKLEGGASSLLTRFYELNKCVGKLPFMALWQKLLDDFPEAAGYLDKELGGDNMKRWGLPWQVSALYGYYCYCIAHVCVQCLTPHCKRFYED